MNIFSTTIDNQLVLIALALIAGIFVSFVCTKTSKCTKNMSFTLFLLPALVTGAILAVNGSLGAGIATLGVFSLVRFRSVPGNSRDIVNVFYTVVCGLMFATGYVALAVTIVLVIGIVMLIASSAFFKTTYSMDLKILVPESMNFQNVFDEIIAKYFKTSELMKVKTTNMGALYELTYKVVPKADMNVKDCLDELRTHNGNLTVSLSRSDDSLEL